MEKVDRFFMDKIEEVYSLCKKLEILELYFFGSAVNGKYIVGQSDLDILVNTEPHLVKNLVKLSIGLKKIYGCKVDTFHKRWRIPNELENHLAEFKVLIYQDKNYAHNIAASVNGL